MFASHNNQRDHDNQSSSQTVNESLAIPPHMGFQDLSQEHDTFEPDDNVFEPDDNVIELGLGLGMMDVQNGLDTHELQEVGESEGEEEEEEHKGHTTTPTPTPTFSPPLSPVEDYNLDSLELLDKYYGREAQKRDWANMDYNDFVNGNY